VCIYVSEKEEKFVLLEREKKKKQWGEGRVDGNGIQHFSKQY
jgi:hypothetical protein